MAVIIPQVITEDRASGAQIIDGSLKFDRTKTQYLTRDPNGTAGNSNTFTISFWYKKTEPGSSDYMLFGAGDSSSNRMLCQHGGFDNLQFARVNSSVDANRRTSRVFRDYSGWQHIVFAVDTTLSTASDRIKIYVNGVRETDFSSSSDPTQNTSFYWNADVVHSIGTRSYSLTSNPFDGHFAQWYNIDGQALGSEYFGYTDALTGTWRPKKYEGTFGTNGFYLPMDGNSPIGEDKSGNGNNWTPVNFGGSNTLEKATGALPILNTDGGGKVARPGVFGSEVGAYYAVTVPSGIGGGYYLDGTQKPTLSLIRGATYTFDQSDSSNSGHPLVFGTTADGNDYSDGVTTNGTPGSAGAYTKITVPHNAPDTLYYHCSAHGGMGSSTSQTTDTKKADPYAWKNVLGLPLVGSANDVSNQINSGSTTKSITANGSIAASNTQSNFYGGSFSFNGSSQYLDISSNVDFALPGEFTLEVWVYWNSVGNSQILSAGTGATSGAFYWQYYSGEFQLGRQAEGSDLTISYTPVAGKWYHLAITRDSSNLVRMFVDGVVITSGTVSSDYAQGPMYIGYGGAGYLNGYMSDVRIYKGVAKYTSNFIPASTSPDILPDTPSGVSGSSKLTKVIEGAVAFDGSGDYLSLTSGSDFQFGSGDFTVECFVYPNSLSNYDPIIDNGSIAGNNQHDWRLYLGSAGEVWFDIESGGSYFNGSGASAGVDYGIRAKKWNHIAISRSGNTVYTFVNGVQKAAVSFSGTIDSDYTTAYIGADNMVNGTMYYFDGFISNLRIIKGTALYTSNFTPPTAPLTNVTNTKLLCCQSNTQAGAAAVSPTVSTSDAELNISFTNTSFPDTSGNSISVSNGNSVTRVAAPSNSYGLTYAAEFTATSEQRLVAGDVGQAFNNPFSFDGFFYLKNIGGTGYLFDGRSSTYTTSFYVYYTTDSSTGTATIYTPQGSFTKPVGQWFHLRCTNSGVWYNGEYQSGASGYGEARFDSIYLGCRYTFSTFMDGYIGAFRFFRYEDIGAPSPEQYVLTSGVPDNILTPLAVRPVGSVATNFNPFTTDINAVRGQETGYATFNPLVRINGGSSVFSDGNLSIRGGSTNGASIATINPTSGKYYFELDIQYVSGQTQGNMGAGIVNELNYGVGNPSGNSYPSTFCGFFTRTEINSVVNGSETGAQVTEPTVGYLWGFTVDYDSKNITFYLNGVEGNTVSFSAVTNPLLYFNWGNTNNTMVVNFGQKPFKFPPPEGFLPLNAANARPSTVIARPDQYVGVTTYTGTGSSRNVNTGFKPDFVWIKKRNAAESHVLWDTVRGATKVIYSESTSQENTDPNGLTSFNSNGFTYGSNGGGNALNDTYVAWCWKAGGNSNTFNIDDVGYDTASAAGLDGGSITPTGASVNTKSGFSIIKYIGNTTGGATVSHGLSQDPKFIMIKNLDQNTTNWLILHTGIGLNGETSFGNAEYKMFRFDNNVPANYSSDLIFPGSNGVFALGEGGSTWSNGAYNYIAYSWHDVPGLQKFGNYTGNGNASGTFVELGFRPALLWIKSTGDQGNWVIVDTQRDQYNPVQSKLYADYNGQENVSNPPGDSASLNNLDILSNGFKMRSDNTWTNGAQVYVYCAWAEVPTFNLYGAQSNAR